MSPMRRVKIDDGRPPEKQAELDADRLQVDEAVLSQEEYEAREREKDCEAEAEDVFWEEFWEERKAEREAAHADEPLRELDLNPVGLDSARKRGKSRVNGKRSPSNRYSDDMEVWQGDDGDHHAGALRVRRSLSVAEDPETEASIKQSRDWLKANDPHLALDGVCVEIAAALDAKGRSLEDARTSAFPNGKPNAAIRELRAIVRTALLPMYHDGRRRVLMAEALGCSRQALHSLMASKSKP